MIENLDPNQIIFIVTTMAVSAVIVPPSMLEEPTSIFPNPLVIEPALRAPVPVIAVATASLKPLMSMFALVSFF